MADKIAENCGNALLVVVSITKLRLSKNILINFFCYQVDNKEVTLGMNANPLRVSQFVDGKWKTKDISE